MGTQVLQVVTQLETAGAQTMAWLLEGPLSQRFDVRSVFLYDKSGSDLFPEPWVLADSRPSSVAAALRLTRALLRLRRQRADVVIAHTHFSIVLSALLWGTQPRTAVIAVHHWPTDRYPLMARLGLRAARRTGLLAREVYVSDAITDAPRDLVIQNPVPPPGPYGDTASIPADIIVVARHAREKSLDTAIRAMHELPRRTLTLVGGGPLTAELESLVHREGLEERVYFTGRLDNPSVRSLLKRCRVFLLPSLWEAMPVSLLEAVAEGAVIVVSDIPAHDFLISRSAALSFRPCDAVGLATTLRRSEDDDTRSRLRDAGVQVRKHLSTESVMSAWDELISDVARTNA